MGIFNEGFLALEQMGVLDVIVPFILVFTVVFAILQKTKILGTADDEGKRPRKNFNAVIALVMALAVVIPHVTGTYPSPEQDVVQIINTALPNVSAVIIAIIMLLLIVGVFGGDGKFTNSKTLSGAAVVIAFVAIILIFGNAANWFQMPNWLNFLQDSDTQALITVILVFGIIIWFITKEDTPKKDGHIGTFEDIARGFGYKKS